MGAIIAASQLSDALKDVLPFTARQKSASALLLDLDALFIEALFEWESVYSAKFTNEVIAERWLRLKKLQHELDVKHFPTGDLPKRPDLLKLADGDASTYLGRLNRKGTEL